MKRISPKWIAGLAAALIFGVAVSAENSIHRAAHQGDVAQLQVLLTQKGIDVNARDSFGGTALHAAMFQKNIKVVELLLNAGFDVNAVGPRNGYTPLHDAVWANNVPAAQLLLAKGARTDIKGKDGMTPYEKAVKEGKTEIARVLQGARR
ncbi:ankyrin repeat domain-containing protein [Rhodobacteraceae bacterium CH30]|nr:ankyrin repeat domain-containing protein [Rhodobacteraceae bacterium CH30]